MSGFPTIERRRKTLEEIGLKAAPVECVHRKLTEEALALFLSEAQKHVDLLSYDELAERANISRGTVRTLMAQLIREKREGIERKRMVRKSSESVSRVGEMNQLADSLRDTPSESAQ